MIQVLIATFFVFGALSFFAIQGNMRRQIEDLSDALVAKAVSGHFNSIHFENEIIGKVDRSVDRSVQVELEAYENRLADAESTAARVDQLEQRVQELQDKLLPPDTEEE
jgi:polyhydroxyalkanoate synthesis regulator phasin